MYEYDHWFLSVLDDYTVIWIAYGSSVLYCDGLYLYRNSGVSNIANCTYCIYDITTGTWGSKESGSYIQYGYNSRNYNGLIYAKDLSLYVCNSSGVQLFYTSLQDNSVLLNSEVKLVSNSSIRLYLNDFCDYNSEDVENEDGTIDAYSRSLTSIIFAVVDLNNNDNVIIYDENIVDSFEILQNDSGEYYIDFPFFSYLSVLNQTDGDYLLSFTIRCQSIVLRSGISNFSIFSHIIDVEYVFNSAYNARFVARVV